MVGTCQGISTSLDLLRAVFGVASTLVDVSLTFVPLVEVKSSWEFLSLSPIQYSSDGIEDSGEELPELSLELDENVNS